MSIMLKEFTREPRIAYFTMEIGLRSDIPTYSGGLGVLAGDTVRSAADLKLPFVAVTLISKKGYFKQELDPSGIQIELPDTWNPSNYMKPLSEKIQIEIEGRNVFVGAWLFVVESSTGGRVPVIFLDTDLPENNEADRTITDHLYGGDESYRFKQEMVLGIGGVRMLDELEFDIRKYHMNEGHSSLLTLELLRKFKRSVEEVWDERLVWDVERVRDLCIFTTHTPVEAAHDKFSYDMVLRIMGEIIPLDILKELGGKEYLNMTLLALNLSEYINGVAKKHMEVSRRLFPGYEIHAITNGVHSYTWTCESLRKLYDKYLPGWANEPEIFVRVDRIPDEELWQAHMEAKRVLIDYINKETGVGMDYDTFTIGFARRATAYKRADLIFSDIERLSRIGKGKIQIIFSGRAHPRDIPGKMLIQRIFQMIDKLKNDIKIVYLKNYNMDLALKLVSGVDLWLNTPQKPLEASGTSGMKAAHNGVPNFSVLDGWWVEGHMEGYTGWSIGSPSEEPSDPARDADDLYFKLENIILPLFYNNRREWIRIMKNAIGKNAYYFNSHRMMRRYVTEAYIR